MYSVLKIGTMMYYSALECICPVFLILDLSEAVEIGASYVEN